MVDAVAPKYSNVIVLVTVSEVEVFCSNEFDIAVPVISKPSIFDWIISSYPFVIAVYDIIVEVALLSTSVAVMVSDVQV